VIYIDTAALMKLVMTEPESAALTDYLRAHTDTGWFTCALTRPELLRAAAAVHPDAVDHAQHVLAGLDMVAVTDRLLDAVAGLTPAPRRLLDALHIAAALSAGPRLHTLITYDEQLAAAARDHNITTIRPGGAPCYAP
jgi:predicted nucleic acid-binding protein